MKIVLSKPTAFVWEEVAVRITECNPSSRVELNASRVNQFGIKHKSSAVFYADSDGIVDLSSSEAILAMGSAYSIRR